MVKVGAIYQSGDRYFRCCSIFPLHLSLADKHLICERFGLTLQQIQKTPHAICQWLGISSCTFDLLGTPCEENGVYESFQEKGDVFAIPLEELRLKNELRLICNDCLYYQQKKKEQPISHTIFYCSLSLQQPLPQSNGLSSKCPHFRANKQPYHITKLASSFCRCFLSKLLPKYFIDDSCISSHGMHSFLFGCPGGNISSVEFDIYLRSCPDKKIFIITQYWDRENDCLSSCAKGFFVLKQEFDYAFYKYMCESMYTAFVFPESKKAIIVHCESAYCFRVDDELP